jgi:hypothetical protein
MDGGGHLVPGLGDPGGVRAAQGELGASADAAGVAAHADPGTGASAGEREANTMTPHLATLFAQAKKPMYSTVDGVNLVDMDAKLARVRLEDLLATHGEALVEALDDAQQVIHSFACTPSAPNQLCETMRELLDALERKAGGVT